MSQSTTTTNDDNTYEPSETSNEYTYVNPAAMTKAPGAQQSASNPTRPSNNQPRDDSHTEPSAYTPSYSDYPSNSQSSSSRQQQQRQRQQQQLQQQEAQQTNQQAGSPPPSQPQQTAQTTPNVQHQQTAVPVVYYPYPYVPHSSGVEKPKRNQVKNACTNCQKACKKCDEERPCGRCKRYGLNDCQDSERKKRTTGSKRGPYRRRTSAPPGEGDSGSVDPETATVTGAASASPNGDQQQGQQQPVGFSYPMYSFSTNNGTHAIPMQPGLFAVYGYSANGMPLGPDGQPIQFGTHYPVPIGFIPTGVPIAATSTSSITDQNQVDNGQSQASGSGSQPGDTGNNVNQDGNGEGGERLDTDRTNGGEYHGHEYSHEYDTPPTLSVVTVDYVEQQTGYDESYAMTGYDNVTSLAESTPYQSSPAPVEEPSPSKQGRKRKSMKDRKPGLDPNGNVVSESDTSPRKKKVKKATSPTPKRPKGPSQPSEIAVPGMT